jgi:hypothetical protein
MTKYIESVRLVNGVKYKINTVPTGGNKGQVLTKSGDGRDELEWLTPEVYDDSELLADIEALEANKANKEDVYTKQQIEDKHYLVAADISGKQDTLTTSQLSAVNSGIDAYKVSAYNAHIADIDIHVTLEDKAEWTSKQEALTEAQMTSVNSGITSDKVNKYDAYEGIINVKANSADVYTKQELDNKLSSVYKYKGTLESVDLLPEEAEVGDVYNADDTGANYAWTGTTWDKLSENIDLTIYATKEQLDLKQDKLTAGANIKIEEDTISCLIESSAGNDDITITLTPQNQLQTVAVKTLNDIIKFDWIGTLAEYETDLERGIITDNTICFVTDD